MTSIPAPQRLPLRGADYRTLLQAYLAPQWRKVALLLTLLLVGAALTLLSPGILAAFIDAVIGSSSANMAQLGGLFLGIAVLNQAVTIATNYLGTDVGLRATNALRADLTLHCLELDLAFHNRTTPGTLIERIDGDVALLNEFLSNFAVLLLKNGLLLVGALAAIWLIDRRAGALLGGYMLVALGLLEAVRRTAVPAVRREREASAQLFGVIEERLAATEDMRANGAEVFVQQGFLEQSRAWSWAHVAAHAAGSNPGRLANVIFAIGLALALGLAAWLVGAQTISIGAAYALFHYVEIMRWPIQQIGRQVQELQQASASIIRVQELSALHSDISDAGTAALPTDALALQFDGVRFAYPTQEPDAQRAAIDDLSFHVPAGAVLGLLGRTGSGKSTMTRLLLRFYEPQQGTIRLNGLPLDSFALDRLRAGIGLVTQEVQIFNASVRENLSLFDPAVPDQRLLAALQAVELDGWFATLPDGLDMIMPPGGGMSAGQAQLLAAARVLLREPGLVILDEASSRLDPATEQRLEHALGTLLAGRTAIIIAHRLATVQRADLIMLLEDGRCVEFGPRAALAADPNSRFAQLLEVGMEEALA